MGRHVERAENLSRLIAVADSFYDGVDAEDDWTPLLQAHYDREAFAETGKRPTGINVARYYLLDAGNSNSIPASLGMARENARSLRHLISTEVWRQLNIFHSEVDALTAQKVTSRRLHEVCQQIRYSCHTHFGLIDGTCYRDEAWLFNQLGVSLERADQTTRLLDINYFRLKEMDSGDGHSLDGWNMLLRSASGYHAFRRSAHAGGARGAIDFLLFDESFPRSTYVAASHALAILRSFETNFGLSNGERVDSARHALDEVLSGPDGPLEDEALHAYLDRVQRALIALSDAIGARYFDPG